MKVFHITNNFPTKKHPIFGIFVKEQIQSLSRIGLENDIFFINSREEGLISYLHGIFSIRKKLKSRTWDIIHCHHAFSAVILALTFAPCKFKTVVSYQNHFSREGGLMMYYIIKKVFNTVINKLPVKDSYYLPNGVDLNYFRPMKMKECKAKLSLNHSIDYILFMDSHKRRSQKRLDRFNEVINLLKEKYSRRVNPIILNNTKRSLVPLFINASSLHLVTSDFEGSPNSVKECMACNTPVVSTPVGNVKDLLRDVKGSYISNSFDVQEIAKLVIKVLNEKNDFNTRAKVVDKSLDINSVAQKLFTIYKETLNEG